MTDPDMTGPAVSGAGWVDHLRATCAAHGQDAVAQRIGYSAPAICQVLAGKYRASTAKIEAAYRGAYMAATVDCPVLGDIATDRCVRSQRSTAADPVSRALRLACPVCPHFKGGKTAVEPPCNRGAPSCP